MDDQIFDKNSALDWIRIIESNAAQIREGDIYPKIRNWIKESSITEILDLGCGQGVCSEKLSLSSCEYIGIDPSPFLIERAKNLYSVSRRTFLIGNAYEIPLPEASVNGIFALAVWHLLSDLNTASRETSRVLKNDGHFLIITAHPEQYDAWISNYVKSSLSGKRFEGKLISDDGEETSDVLFLHRLDEIQIALKEANLEILEMESFRKFLMIKGRKTVSR